MLWKIHSAVAALVCVCSLFMMGACDQPGDGDNGTTPVVALGQVIVDNVSSPLGYGEMVVAPLTEVNQTVIELFTSAAARDSGTCDMVGITLYHAEDSAPEDTYDVLQLMDGGFDGHFVCNILLQDGGNFACDSGILTFARTATGITITVEAVALSTTDSAEHTVEIEYNGPVLRLN